MNNAMQADTSLPQVPSDALFLNRELSLLAFNQRVLAQAEDVSVPLLERLKYLCIVSSNLDEFFEIRLTGLLVQDHEQQDKQLLLSAAASAKLDKLSEECHRIVDRQYQLLNTEILPALATHHIHLLQPDAMNAAQQAWVKQYFENEVRPLLTLIGLDPAHPFPQVVNKSLNFIVELSGKDAFGRNTGITILKVPRVLPRVIQLPDNLATKGVTFCLLSSVIGAHIADLFAGREVVSYSQFRVTRNSDLWVDEDEIKNLRQALETELHSRQFGFAIRLEVDVNCPTYLSDFLLRQFSINKNMLYVVDGPVNMVRLMQLANSIKEPSLVFPPFTPKLPEGLAGTDVFKRLKKRDILLHHPYQSFQPVVDFIRYAASDPQVVAIKQTIYRAGSNSELIEALILAAKNGKEVTVIVELMARFDEEANINWAERLERAGAQVVYGVVGLKTHAKLALVLRRENGVFHYYAHLGTGNYNPGTARFYTDFGLLTANPAITVEVNEVFIQLTGLTKPKLQNLWLAPFSLHKELVRCIRQEVENAKLGKPAHIIAKMNSLTEEKTIQELYKASQAGVKIDLIIRGACSLRPGVAGLSENIRVRSIVGRFLEHSRIYYFANNHNPKVYLASADWMNRNLFRRVEVAFPIFDNILKKRIINEGLKPYLKDNVSAWELQSDGHYLRKKPRARQQPFSAQIYLATTLGHYNEAN